MVCEGAGGRGEGHQNLYLPCVGKKASFDSGYWHIIKSTVFFSFFYFLLLHNGTNYREYLTLIINRELIGINGN